MGKFFSPFGEKKFAGVLQDASVEVLDAGNTEKQDGK